MVSSRLEMRGISLAFSGFQALSRVNFTLTGGSVHALTGANGAGGADEYDGIKLANKLYPTILGKKVELVVVDNKSDKVEAANAATVLAQKEKVNAVLGSWGSSLSMAGGPIFAEAKIPAVAVSATNPNVTKGNEHYFRVCFLDPFQGTVGAAYAFNELKAKKVAVIREVSNDYSVGLAKFFVDHFVKLSGDEKSIVATADYNTGDQDFSAQLTNIKQFEPDVIFAPGNYTESALIIKQARDLGITAKFITSYIGDYNSIAMGVDLGLNYYDSEEEWSVSAVARNLGGQLKAYDEEYEKMPIDLQVGVSKHFINTPFRVSATLVNLNHWDKGIRNHAVLGADLLLGESLWVGAGYNFRRHDEMKIVNGEDETSSHGAGWSLGGGINLERFHLNIAYGKYHVSSNSLLLNIDYRL